MAESSNGDSSQESSKGSTKESAEDAPQESTQESAEESGTEPAKEPAKAPTSSASKESSQTPAKTAKSAGTSGWKSPSGKPASKTASKAPAKTSSTRTSAARTTEKPAKETSQVDVNAVRSWLATAIWVLAVIAALIMAGGALAVSLDFNEKNAIVKFVTDTADSLKIFGDFKTFKGSNHEVKDVLVNNGIYAILYLVVGKVLDRLIRP